jgi:hypothetical protein
MRRTVFLLGGVALALALAALSPLASPNKDGLEKVSEEHGIAPLTSEERSAPIPNYWEEAGPARKIAAGVIGTLLVFGLTIGLGEALKKRK